MTDVHRDSGMAPRVRALETLLEQRGVVGGAELDAILDQLLTTGSPLQGAKVVARAWTDDGFRARLLDDGTAALAELGLSMGHGPAPVQLRVVRNTAAVHNVIVCTLCSCYPVSLLGPSPSWYKSAAYRARMVRWPREVLAEFGLTLGAEVEIRVWDSTSETRFLVLPRPPDNAAEMSEEQLAAEVTRAGMIGTAAI
jgi:nitrile hydratase